jgi:hypothetical protein
MREKSADKLTHQEWLEAGWQGATEALEMLISLAKEHNLRRLKVGRPYDIEIELAPDSEEK